MWKKRESGLITVMSTRGLRVKQNMNTWCSVRQHSECLIDQQSSQIFLTGGVRNMMGVPFFFLILTLSAGWRECGLQNCSSNKRPTILGEMCLSDAIPYRRFAQGHTMFEWLSHFLILASISGPPRQEAGNGNRIEKSLQTTKHTIGVSVCSISSTLLRWEHTLLEQVSTVCCHCQEYSSHYSKRHAGPRHRNIQFLFR